jgi:hypothetical protein
MRAAMTQLNLSARAYYRTQSVKLARPIADLARCEEIQAVHLAEALHAHLHSPALAPEASVKLNASRSGASLAAVRS